jgi:Protein of unknown function (DUF3606)
MVDEAPERDRADPAQVNIYEGYEVWYWCEKWGISVALLKEAVIKVGPMAGHVANYLGKLS